VNEPDKLKAVGWATDSDVIAKQLFPSVAVTEYKPVVKLDTSAVVALVFH